MEIDMRNITIITFVLLATANVPFAGAPPFLSLNFERGIGVQPLVASSGPGGTNIISNLVRNVEPYEQLLVRYPWMIRALSANVAREAIALKGEGLVIARDGRGTHRSGGGGMVPRAGHAKADCTRSTDTGTSSGSSSAPTATAKYKACRLAWSRSSNTNTNAIGGRCRGTRTKAKAARTRCTKPMLSFL
jgi:hypothetical protein